MGTKTHDYPGRKFVAEIYDREYFEGDRSKSGYDDYKNAENMVKDQYHMIDNVMNHRMIRRPAKEAMLIDGMPVTVNKHLMHLDVGCAYGYGAQAMVQHGWESHGFDISEFAITEGNQILANRTVKPRLYVGNALQSDPYFHFKDKEVDLVTSVEFFEHIESKDARKVLRFMARVANWGFFVINGSTGPATSNWNTEHDNDPDHGHLNHHPMEWWINEAAQFGEIDFDAMLAFNMEALKTYPHAHWHNRVVVVKFD